MPVEVALSMLICYTVSQPLLSHRTDNEDLFLAYVSLVKLWLSPMESTVGGDGKWGTVTLASVASAHTWGVVDTWPQPYDKTKEEENVAMVCLFQGDRAIGSGQQ